MNFDYNLNDLEGTIGGSILDDLREMMGLPTLNDGDIIFAKVQDSDVKLNEVYDLPDGTTFVARCTIKNIKDYKLVTITSEYGEWMPVE